MELSYKIETNSSDFWKAKTRLNKKYTKKEIKPIASQMRQRIRSAMPEGERRKANMTPSYRARRARYGRLKTSVRTFVLTQKQIRKSKVSPKGTFYVVIISAQGSVKRKLPAAYWVRWVIQGTNPRRTRRGYNRGKIEPRRNLWTGQTGVYRSGVFGPAVERGLKRATKEAAQQARIRTVR